MSKFDEVKIAPPDMRCEERKREAEFLKQASSEDLKKMFDQVFGLYSIFFVLST